MKYHIKRPNDRFGIIWNRNNSYRNHPKTSTTSITSNFPPQRGEWNPTLGGSVPHAVGEIPTYIFITGIIPNRLLGIVWFLSFYTESVIEDCMFFVFIYRIDHWGLLVFCPYRRVFFCLAYIKSLTVRCPSRRAASLHSRQSYAFRAIPARRRHKPPLPATGLWRYSLCSPSADRR